MRRLTAAELSGAFLLCLTAGCGPEKKAVEPTQQMELPQDPTPVGGAAPKGAKGGIKMPADAPPPSSDQ